LTGRCRDCIVLLMSGQEQRPKPVAARLSALMAAEDLRPEDVASDLHISHRTVTRWLEGRTEPTPTLARALGVRFDVEWGSFYQAPDERKGRVMLRACIDCGLRYEFKPDPDRWQDPLECPACLSDETVAIPDVAPEREMATLTGEGA